MKTEKIVFLLSILVAIYFAVYFALYFSGQDLPKVVRVFQELFTLPMMVIGAGCLVVALVNVFKQGFRLRSRYFYALLIMAVVLGFILGVTLMEEDLIDF